MTTPSHQDVYDQSRTTGIVARPDLLMSPGDAADLPAQEAASVGDLLLGHFAGEIRKTFLDGAEGDDLKKLVLDRYGITAPPATPAIGSVTFSRSTSGAGTIAAGTRVASQVASDGSTQTFTTDVATVWGSSDTSKTVTVTAALPGSDGNVDAATITRVLDTLFDTFAVTNAARAVGGHEAATDPEIRDLARGYVKSLRKGTVYACEYGAKLVPQVRVATLYESSTPGLSTLYVSDANGNSNAAMVTAAQAEIDSGTTSGTTGWRAAGCIVTVVGATVVSEAISFTLTVRTGVDAAAIVDAARAAVVTAVNRLGVGQTLYRSLIVAAAKSVAPDNITDVAVSTPAANIAPLPSQLIRTSLSICSGS